MRDGFLSLMGGQHETLATMLLKKGSYHKGVNTTVRNGLISTRPAYKEIIIETPCGEEREYGAFKGAKFADRNEDSLLCVVTGTKVHMIDLEAGKIVDELASQFASDDYDRAYILQAEHAFVIQNGKDDPIIHLTRYRYNEIHTDELEKITYEEARPHEKTDNTKMPIGKMMIYLHGRIFLVTKKRIFRAGNLFMASNEDSFLNFSEEEYLSGGGGFSLPSNLGNITALSSAPNAGSTVQGAMQVHTGQGVASFGIGLPRYIWGDADISSVLYVGAGASSDRSMVNSNNDLLFRTNDGIRSLSTDASLSNASEALKVHEMSLEVGDTLSKGTRLQKELSTMGKANNRVYCTTDPFEASFKSMTVLDLLPAGSVQSSAPPAWEGVWTGLNILQIENITYQGKSRILIIAHSPNGIRLFTVDEDEVLDPGDTPIKSRVYTASFMFDDPDMKILEYVDVSVSDIKTDSTLTVYYRPTGYPLWAEMNTQEMKVPVKGLTQPRRKLRFTPDSMAVPFNPITDAKLTSGYAFEFCVEWSGRLSIDSFVAEAKHGYDEVNVASAEVDAVPIIEGKHGISLDDLDYDCIDLESKTGE